MNTENTQNHEEMRSKEFVRFGRQRPTRSDGQIPRFLQDDGRVLFGFHLFLDLLLIQPLNVLIGVRAPNRSIFIPIRCPSVSAMIGQIHSQSSSKQLPAVHVVDGLLRIVGVLEFDESESAMLLC